MIRNFIVATLIGVLVLLSACGTAATPTQAVPSTPAPVTLVVFTAASLTAAFTDIGQQFEATHPGVTVVFNFAGSQQLAQQLGQGAPADVFASANKAQMNVAVTANRVVSGTAQVFARNRLVVIVPKDNPAKLATLQDLARPGLKVVLAAQEVPVGQYALDFFDKASADAAFGPTFKEAALANVVSYEQDVKSVLAKIALGEADAGIVYTTDLAGGNGSKVASLEIPDALNTLASYPLAVISDSAHAALAQEFVALVMAPSGQATLAQYGFLPGKP